MQPTLHLWAQGVAHILVGHGEIKPFRIEMPATPPPGIGVFGIRFIRHDFQETLVSGHATNIFGRPGTRSINAVSVLGCGIKGPEFLNYDRMAPAITEVIEITEDGTLFEIAKMNVTEIENTRVVVKGIFSQ